MFVKQLTKNFYELVFRRFYENSENAGYLGNAFNA